MIIDPAPRPQDEHPSTMLRPLGTFERVFHLWMRNNPLHFSLIAELDGPVAPDELQDALDQVQRRHPLLAARVVDDEERGPSFHRCDAPIELTVVEEPSTWEEVVSVELTRPFDGGTAPLVRAVLLAAEGDRHLVLTFERSIADGRSAAGVLADLLAALNGQLLRPRPLPPAQEELTARMASPQPPLGHPAATGQASVVDERMSAVGRRRPFDASSPAVCSATFDAALTRRLVARCRTESTTVHSAICAAATQVLMPHQRSSFVRVMSPIDLRHLIDPGEGVGLYIGVARTGSSAEEAQDLWDLARATQAALAPARSARGVAAAAAATAAVVPVRADAAAAEAFMLAGMSFEVDISNLGVLELPEPGPLHATAVWGPVLLNQVHGEQVIGVTTYRGSLRMTCASHTVIPSLLHDIRDALASAT